MNISLVLCAVSLLSAAAYGGHFVHQAPGALRTCIKGLAVGSLTLISVACAAPFALTLALGFGTFGDLFLSRRGTRNFLFGLVSFLVGHLAYVALLWQFGGGFTPLFSQPYRLIAALGLLGLGAIVLRRLLPHLGALRLPVLGYAVVILVMGLFALSLPLYWPIGLATLGALMFIASDAILGFELFIYQDRPRIWAATLLWALYWGGQFLIMIAILWHVALAGS